MKREVVLLAMAVLLWGGCSTQREVSRSAGAGGGGVAESRPCIANFSVEGGFWSGRSYKSFQEFPKAMQAEAFERVAAKVASDGWQVNTANRDLGIISASQTVSYGRGKTSPLNVVVKKRASGGIRVEVVYQTSGGVAVSGHAVQTGFCEILEAAAG
jgi:hypothetical protein